MNNIYHLTKNNRSTNNIVPKRTKPIINERESNNKLRKSSNLHYILHNKSKNVNSFYQRMVKTLENPSYNSSHIFKPKNPLQKSHKIIKVDKKIHITNTIYQNEKYNHINQNNNINKIKKKLRNKNNIISEINSSISDSKLYSNDGLVNKKIYPLINLSKIIINNDKKNSNKFSDDDIFIPNSKYETIQLSSIRTKTNYTTKENKSKNLIRKIKTNKSTNKETMKVNLFSNDKIYDIDKIPLVKKNSFFLYNNKKSYTSINKKKDKKINDNNKNIKKKTHRINPIITLKSSINLLSEGNNKNINDNLYDNQFKNKDNTNYFSLLLNNSNLVVNLEHLKRTKSKKKFIKVNYSFNNQKNSKKGIILDSSRKIEEKKILNKNQKNKILNDIKKKININYLEEIKNYFNEYPITENNINNKNNYKIENNIKESNNKNKIIKQNTILKKNETSIKKFSFRPKSKKKFPNFKKSIKIKINDSLTELNNQLTDIRINSCNNDKNNILNLDNYIPINKNELNKLFFKEEKNINNIMNNYETL